jgi:hypothetical protein
MSDAPSLGLEAVDLMLSIAETPAMAISSAALADFHVRAGTMLIAAHALKPEGFEAVAISQTDHEDAIVNLIWSSEVSGYAYFNPATGLVRVDDDMLRCHQLDISWFLRWVAGQLGLGPRARQLCLIPNRLWDLGDIWLGEGKRTRRKTTIYVARRLNEPATVTQVVNLLRVHWARPGKVILTTTHDPHLARTLTANSCAVLSINTCARAGMENFELDTAIIYSAAHGLRASYTESSVQAHAEFRDIRIGEREFHFGGDKQREVVGFLYKRWQNGEGRVSTATMFEELGWSNTKRLRDLFKGHSGWQELIGYRAGSCWLRCDELLTRSGMTSD